ncbi:MAG: DUF503 domain-containing protein [Pseudomonadota bacterium]
MVVGALKMTLHVADSGGLKPKRKVARAILDRVRAKFNTAAAEVGGQDTWQRLELGFAVCGNETGHVQNQLDEIGRFVERLGLAEVADVRVELMSLKDMTWAPAAGAPWKD